MGCGASKDGVQIPKRTLSSRYLVQQELRAGSFGACYYATTVRNGVPCKDEHSGFAVAIKKICSSDPKFKYAKVVREVRVMRMLKHTHVVRLLDYLEHKDAFYVVLEFVAGGDLFDRITLRGAMPECVGAFVTCQVLDALVYMHANGVCHRDIKPENILMMSADESSPLYNHIKIADFGLSTDKARGYCRTMATPCGTPEFSSPELLNCAGHRGTQAVGNEGAGGILLSSLSPSYSSKVDMWSTGAVLYCILSGVPPFSCVAGSESVGVMILKIQAGALEFPAKYWGKISREAISCVSVLMQVDPDLRATAKECLEHVWFQSVQADAAETDAAEIGSETASSAHSTYSKRASSY